MMWMLAVCVSLSLSALLIRLILVASYRPVLPTESTLRECEAALCVFRLLVDSQEEVYLRTTLSPPEFRSVHRKRLRLAMRYLILLDRNATLLAATAQQAALSGDSDLAQRGKRLADSSLQLKGNLLAAEIAVVVKWLFPTSALFLRVAKISFPRSVPSLAAR
jgi:hypothetical protein